MSRLPRLTAKEIISVLVGTGFVLSRQSGSHKIYINPEGKRVTVPFHGKRIIHPKILRNIMKDAEVSVSELKKFL